MSLLLLVLDLVGTFVFAISGATAGVTRRLDLFGTLVLSFVAGNVGGIIRDVLIGSVPPAAISHWWYLAVSLLAGVITFFWSSAVDKLANPVLVFDAAGLALFAVSGAEMALASGLNPVMAALLGMVTGVGGGIARDVLVAEIPTVLRADIYAVAALAGAGLVVIGQLLHIPATATTIVGALVCFGLRLMAIRRGWHLPIARQPERSSNQTWVFNLHNESLGMPRTLASGIRARVFAGQNVMLSVVKLEPNAVGTMHSHREEQWGLLLEGECTRLQGDEAIVMKVGDFWHTPGGVLHAIRAGSKGALVLDIFSPPRQEYTRGGEGFGQAQSS